MYRLDKAVNTVSKSTIPWENRLTQIPYYYAEDGNYLIKDDEKIIFVKANNPIEAVGKAKEKSITAKWKVYDGEKCPQCTHCGMGMPFARYTQKTGVNGREITDYCPNCGSKMIAIDQCEDCPHAENGYWQDDGICFACREDTWVYGQPIRVYEEEKKTHKI